MINFNNYPTLPLDKNQLCAIGINVFDEHGEYKYLDPEQVDYTLRVDLQLDWEEEFGDPRYIMQRDFGNFVWFEITIEGEQYLLIKDQNNEKHIVNPKAKFEMSTLTWVL